MTDNEEQPRRPGRPKREEVTNTERRRRKAGNTTHKLAIPDHIKRKHPGMEFRWGRDEDGRIEQLTQADDWDPVPDVQPIHAGVGKTGAGIKLHLLMKSESFMEMDRAEKMERILKTEKDQLAHLDKKQAIEAGAETYAVPGNKL